MNEINENIKLYNGDYLDVMDRLIEQGIKVDAIITDPPYGVSYQSNFKKQKFEKLKNDHEVQAEWIHKAETLLKDGGAIYVFTRWDVYPEWLEIIKKHFKVKNCIVWHKQGGGLGDLKSAYIYNHEFVIYAMKGKHILQGKRSSDVWNIPKEAPSTYLHPTHKPVALIEQAIIKSTQEDQVILDLFMGSGTTGVACINTNRKFIGIELDENYFKIAEERIHKALEENNNID